MYAGTSSDDIISTHSNLSLLKSYTYGNIYNTFVDTTQDGNGQEGRFRKQQQHARSKSHTNNDLKTISERSILDP
jgi:hypothetical protein